MADDKVEIKKITVHNKISSNYRQLHVDGAFGGVTPMGFMNLSFYGERAPIPKATDYNLTDEGFLGSVISNSPDTKTGILREFEFGIYMNLNVAKAMVVLLNSKIEEFESVTKNL
jgi:hypothetical protein